MEIEEPQEIMDNDVEEVEKRTLIGPGMLLLLGVLLAGLRAPAMMQTTANARKVKSSVPPEYPELARRLNLKGTARVAATVSADGQVIKVTELGGNPILLDALTRAVKK